MKFKDAKKKILHEIGELIRPHGFLWKSSEGGDQSWTTFEKKVNGRTYQFSVGFLYHFTTLSIESYIGVTFDEMTLLAKKARIVDKEVPDYGAMSVCLGYVVNRKNADGFFNDNDDKPIEAKYDELEIDKAIKKLYKTYFVKAATPVMDSTCTMKKTDELINGWILKMPEDAPFKVMTYFASNRPWQIKTGILAAKLANNPHYDELVKRYTAVAHIVGTGNSGAKDFFKLVAYFKKSK